MEEKHELLEQWFSVKEQKHEGCWYVKLTFQGRDICAVLSQARVFSSARLYSRLGELPDNDIERVQEGFQNLYLSAKIPEEKISPKPKA